MIIVNMFEFSEKVGFESPSRTGALTEGGRVRIILDFLNDDAKKIAFQSIRDIYIPPPNPYQYSGLFAWILAQFEQH